MPAFFTNSSTRGTRLSPSTTTRTTSHKMVPLPIAPTTGSPVPPLTSIHSTVERGPYGDRRYRGNCDGYLIRDLLRYYQAKRVLDPMTGSGTCQDVCAELDVDCHSFDLKLGQDATDPQSYQGIGTFDFMWLHPPYWRMIRYNDDPKCLSSAPTAFLEGMRNLLSCGHDVLTDRGVIAVLIGGYTDQESHRHIPLAALTNQVALEVGLWPVSTEIIRFQHGNTSSRRQYRSSFIPGLHDTCMLFGKLD